MILSKYGLALCLNPAVFRPSLSAVSIAPSEPECSSLWKMIEI
jgi:hypothetical protein